jgi:hypothetical protein
MIPAPARYEEWLEFCFGQFAAAIPGDTAWSLLGDNDFDASPEEIIELFEATMLRSGTDLVGYSDMTLAIGLQVMFYDGPSSICDSLCSPFHPPLAHRKAIRSIERLYVDCLDRRGLTMFTGEDIAAPNYDLASRVFMLWDMSPLPYRADCKTTITLVEAVAGALSCNSVGCLQSAIHGLGHMSAWGRSRQRLDEFLLLRGDELPPELRDYAQSARIGDIL